MYSYDSYQWLRNLTHTTLRVIFLRENLNLLLLEEKACTKFSIDEDNRRSKLSSAADLYLIMVDVKLDVDSNPLNKLAGSKKNSSFSVCSFLIYLAFVAGFVVIGLDAAEFISLGIVKDVMGLKVMKYEEYDTIASSLDSLKKEVEEAKASVQMKDTELAAKNTAVTDMTNKFNAANTEKAAIQQQVDEKQNALNAVTAEKDALTNQLAEEKAKVTALTTERDALKAAAEAPKPEAPKPEAPKAEAPKAEAPKAEENNKEE